MQDIERRVRLAIQHFWGTRQAQSQGQGRQSGLPDQGERKTVTAGAHMDGFITLVQGLLIEQGIPDNCIFSRTRCELPGYFRSDKQWDLIVVVEGCLLISLEVKSQVGSFGNNFNNRTEEALGNATDIWTAYREGAFRPSARPWTGYLMLLEETAKSTTPVAVREPHFRVFNDFRGASYAMRYEILLTRLVRERLYDSACLLLSSKEGGIQGDFREPSAELSFKHFATSLIAKALAH